MLPGKRMHGQEMCMCVFARAELLATILCGKGTYDRVRLALPWMVRRRSWNAARAGSVLFTRSVMAMPPKFATNKSVYARVIWDSAVGGW